jgi:hypothetical protein
LKHHTKQALFLWCVCVCVCGLNQSVIFINQSVTAKHKRLPETMGFGPIDSRQKDSTCPPHQDQWPPSCDLLLGDPGVPTQWPTSRVRQGTEPPQKPVCETGDSAH